MIPKIIHYCWFGGKALPDSARQCIESWKKFMPEYEIKEWNENNFDVNSIQYTKEAYSCGKYAFVSDYARFYILEKFGGLYLDTDVEIIKSLEPILKNGSYMGIENGVMVNPGLGMGAEPHSPFLKEVINHYKGLSFLRTDGTINYDTVVFYTTNILKTFGWTGAEKNIAGINIYPKEYFCPLDYETGELKLTENTYTIHHYSATWITPKQMLYRKIKRLLGQNFASCCSSMYKKFK